MVLFFISCEKYEVYNEDTINKVDERFVVKNGVVHFTSIESFQNTIQEIQNFGSYDLAEWERRKGIENSLRKFQEELVETDGNSTPSNWLIPDQKFATVVSRHGFFAIGDSMHLITRDREYIFKIGDITDYMNIEGQKNVKIFNIIDGVNSKSWSDKVYYFNHINFNIPPTSARGTYRVIAYAWSKSWAAYCSNGVGLKCEFRDRNFWGNLYWRSARFDFVQVCGNARFYLNGNLQGIYNCDSGTNTSDEDCYLGQGVGIINTDWIVGNFTYQFDDNWPIYNFDDIWD